MSMAPSSSPSSRWSRGSKSNVGRLADLAQRDEVVFAAGRHAVDDRGWRWRRAADPSNRASASVARSLRLLHPGGELLRLGDERRLLLLRGRRRPACRTRSARPAAVSNSAIASRRSTSAASGLVDEVDGVAARLLRALDDLGFSRSSCGSITAPAYSGGTALPAPADPHGPLAKVSDMPRDRPRSRSVAPRWSTTRSRSTSTRLRAAVDAAPPSRPAGARPLLVRDHARTIPATGQAKQALDDGADVVLAAGGDGTVRAVAEALRGSGVALALLPSGTGQPARPQPGADARRPRGVACDAPSPAATARIDLGVVEIDRDGRRRRETHAFLVMAGLGIDAADDRRTPTPS